MRPVGRFNGRDKPNSHERSQQKGKCLGVEMEFVLKIFRLVGNIESRLQKLHQMGSGRQAKALTKCLPFPKEKNNATI